MDKHTRAIIEAVTIDLLKGATNTPFCVDQVSQIDDNTLLNFILTFYD